MSKPDTKSAALSRLFGNKPGTDVAGERPEEDQAVQKKGRKATPNREKKKSSATPDRTRGVEPAKETQEKTSTASAKEVPSTKRRQKPEQTTADSAQTNERLNQKTSQEPLAPPESLEEEHTEESGYLGSGRYRRTTGVLERISPYIRPDQAEALRVAVALRNDPRGSDISAIIQSLLDEAGYHGEDS